MTHGEYFLPDGPKGTSAGPPTEVDGGRKVSLVCSSRANPPVESYVWFRIKDGARVVGNGSELVTGEDGEYVCGATNKHGSLNSSAVTVKIRGEFGDSASLSSSCSGFLHSLDYLGSSCYSLTLICFVYSGNQSHAAYLIVIVVVVLVVIAVVVAVR